MAAARKTTFKIQNINDDSSLDSDSDSSTSSSTSGESDGNFFTRKRTRLYIEPHLVYNFRTQGQKMSEEEKKAHMDHINKLLVEIKPRRRVCLVTLMGLPCSGKTFLCTNLKSFFSDWEYSHMLYISYDDFVPLEVQKQFPTTPNAAKCIRKNFVSTVRFLAKILSTPESKQDSVWTDFKSSLSEDADSMLPSSTFVSTVSNILAQNKDVVDALLTHVTILIDDNNYYKSMRQQFYTVARENKLGFCVLYCYTPLSVCLERNSKREESSKVPEDVIRNMDKLLERPDFMKTECDTFCVQVDHDKPTEDNITIIVHALTKAISTAASSLPADRSELIERERKICSENAVHQADLIMRKWLNTELSTVEPGSKSNLAKELSTKKRIMLEKLRSGEIKLRFGPEDESEEFRKEILDVFKNIKIEEEGK